MSALLRLLDHYGVQYRADRQSDQPISCPSAEHRDRHASASLNLEKEVFHCHGCAVGGGALELLMCAEGGISRPDALAKMKQIVGEVAIEHRSTRRSPQPRTVRRGRGWRPRFGADS